MSDTADVITKVTTLLDAARIPYMVAGSFASSIHGKPRTTQDLDVVIDADRQSVEALVRELPPDDWYADLDAARDAVQRRTMFNLIDMTSGWKVDLIVRKNRPFSIAEFERRTLTEALGVSFHVATAEDTVIAKLEWSKDSGGSERQRRDIQGILELKGSAIDRAYVERWVADLGLADEWHAVTRT
jgi:hypothetical protein